MKLLKKLALPNNAYNITFSKGFVVTQEGNAAIEDAITYLQGAMKSYPLYWSDGLYNSSKVHVSDLQAGKVIPLNNGSSEFT